MHYLAGVPMEVQAFLPNGCGGKDERTKRRIESHANVFGARHGFVCDGLVDKRNGEVAAHLLCVLLLAQ